MPAQFQIWEIHAALTTHSCKFEEFTQVATLPKFSRAEVFGTSAPFSIKFLSEHVVSLPPQMQVCKVYRELWLRR